MIYEFRTYTLQLGTLPKVLEAFAGAYEHRKQFSELAAFWYTDIGPLNQIIHVWPYADMAERARVRAEAAQHPNWPPPTHEYLVHMESEIINPAPYSPELTPGKIGPIFEMRYYMAKPGMIHQAMEATGKALAPRLEYSSLAFAGFTETGPLNKYVHVWPYQSLEQRSEVRRTVVEKGIWPPPGGGDKWLSQANKILLAAPFSPVQ